MLYFLLIIVIFCIFMSIRTLFIPNIIKGKLVSIDNFFYLGTCYLTVIIGYGLIYLLLELMGITVLKEMGGENHSIFETSFYFSAMMLFSVGNGDVIPQEFGRLIAVSEALIGYTLPAAFVAKVMFDKEK